MDQRHSHGKHIYVEYVPVGSSQTEGGEEIVMDQRHSQKLIYVEYVPVDAWPKEGGERNFTDHRYSNRKHEEYVLVHSRQKEDWGRD